MKYKSIKILTFILPVFFLSLCSTIKPTLHSNFYLRNNSLRIVHGIPAKVGDFPYQVSFKKGGPLYSSFCGGSIIKPNVVLSAAHCFVKKSKGICFTFWRGSRELIRISDVYVVAGSLINVAARPEYNSNKTCEQWRRLETVKYPYNYNFPRQDIALVFTKKPWQYNMCVGFINPAVKDIEYQMSCIASGYGRTTTGMPSPVLLYTPLRVIPTAICSNIHHLNMMHYVCTYSWGGDVAKGDSGGPLVCKEPHPNDLGPGLLVGITCGKRGYHTFFTRVSSYTDYIMSNNSNVAKLTILSLLCTSLILVVSNLIHL